MTPKLSVVLPAMLGFDSVRPAIEAWNAQTRCDELELLIVCPKHLGPSAAQLEKLAGNAELLYFDTEDLHEARALGVRRALAEYVMLAEDHCLPDPNWAEAILHRMQEGWDIIGPALRPGTRTGSWPEGSFLISYGQWMEPCASGPVTILPGWNDVFRAQPLRDLGINLAQELRLGTFLIHRLKSTGCRLYLEDRARMRHFDPPNWRFEVLIAAIVGSGFGALRTQHWPIVARIAYPLGAPLIALLHWKRGWVQYNRVRPAPPVRPMALVAAFGLAIAWALGESAGAWLGPRRVTPHLWRAETKPPRFEDVARSNAEEREFV